MPNVSDSRGASPAVPAGAGAELGADSPSVRAQLERVLASSVFANAERLSRFLRFAVEQVLDGKGDRLKEYVLGVEVFDRDERYDPRLDSIVRVEARRLRAKLDEYYASAGAADTLVIQLPKGSYVPQFTERAAAGAAVASASGAPPVPRRWPVVWIGAALLLIAAVAAAVLLTRRERDVSRGSGEVALAVLPFVDHRGGAEAVARQLTDGLIGELTRVSGVAVRSRTSVMQFEGVRRPLPEISRALDARLVMEGSVALEGGRLIVEARLVHATMDRKVWAKEFEGTPADLRELQRRIAADATAVLKDRALR
jgi:TolB-like protein